MNLKTKFTGFSDYELISIAEPHTDYTDEAKNFAIDIIMERHHKDYKKYANEYWEEYILKNIKTILKSRIIPKSHFLDNLEMKTIVKDCFEKWKEEQELFGIDTTKYWVV